MSDERLIAVISRAVELSGQAQIARAVHQPGQQSHSYAPHITVTTPKAAAPAELPLLTRRPRWKPSAPPCSCCLVNARSLHSSAPALLRAAATAYTWAAQ